MHPRATDSGVASPNIWRGLKVFLGGEMFDRRITLFCLEKRFSKHNITIFSKNFGAMAPLAPPGYAYATENAVAGHMRPAGL